MTDYIHYEIGDACYPVGDGLKFIVHVCNNLGKWGKGFTESIDNRWDKPEKQYRLEHKFYRRLLMGSLQIVPVEEDIYVINMIAQQGVWYKGRTDPPIRYEELEECLEKVGVASTLLDASVHMPRIGCGLAGGEWDKVFPLINKKLCKSEVYIYDNL